MPSARMADWQYSVVSPSACHTINVYPNILFFFLYGQREAPQLITEPISSLKIIILCDKI